MKYGYFDDQAREYVITRPDTPRPWSNYLGSTEYGAIITNHAGGYSFYKSGAKGRFLRMRYTGQCCGGNGAGGGKRGAARGDLMQQFAASDIHR